MNKKLTVIIPVHNALNDVKILFNSIIKNFNFKLGEIVVINDYSDAKTSLYLEQTCLDNNLKLITNNKNLGFIKSCNTVLKNIDTDIAVLLNSDTAIPSNFCEKIIQCFESNEKIGIASPVASHNFKDLTKIYNKPLEIMNKRLCKKHISTYPIMPSCEGFCYCIKKEVMNKQGYLDEIFGKGYHEEIDYSYRAITNGWINVLIDNLYVYHKHHASFGIEKREYLINQNDKVFNKRWKHFRTEYIKNNCLTNPNTKIAIEIFPFYIRFISKILKILPSIKKTIKYFIITTK